MAPQADAFGNWAKFLNPDSLKGNLIAASLFLAAYETLKSTIIEQIRSFHTLGFDQNDWITDTDYQSKVLSLHKSPLRASLLWLKEQGAIDEADLKQVDRIREHRNELAHDLRKFFVETEAEINHRLLGSIYELTSKIDRWWILEVEISTNPDFDHKEVAVEEIQSGSMIFLQILMHVATSDDPALYWDKFQKFIERDLRPSNRRG